MKKLLAILITLLLLYVGSAFAADITFEYDVFSNKSELPSEEETVFFEIEIENTSDETIYFYSYVLSGEFESSPTISLDAKNANKLIVEHVITTEEAETGIVEIEIVGFTDENRQTEFIAYSWPVSKASDYVSKSSSYFSSYHDRSNRYSEISDDLKCALVSVAKKHISNHLASPSTADFPAYSVWDVEKGKDNVYSIVGYVDVQNYFGAVLREIVGAMIQYDGTYSSVLMVQIGDEIYFN